MQKLTIRERKLYSALTIVAICFFFIGLVVDLSITFTVAKWDKESFLKYEANQEAKDVVLGNLNFPYFYIFVSSIPLFLLSILYLIITKTTWLFNLPNWLRSFFEIHLFLLLFLITTFFGLLRFLGGLSWLI